MREPTGFRWWIAGLEKTNTGWPRNTWRKGRAQAPVWDVNSHHHLEWKKPMPFVNHYSFHIVDRDWGHVTIKISGHPPFPAQIILNGHEYVACQARKAGLEFSKEGNCFTTIVNVAGLAKIADTLSEFLSIGRLRQVCSQHLSPSHTGPPQRKTGRYVRPVLSPWRC